MGEGFGFLTCGYGCGCEVWIYGVAMKNEILIWVSMGLCLCV